MIDLNDTIPVSSTADLSPDAVRQAPTAPVEHIVTPKTPAVVPQGVSMEETIRAKYREMNKPAEAIRGVDGKFQKPADLAGQTVVQDSAAEAVAEEPVEPVVEPAKPVVDSALEKPPSSWKKETQGKWAAIDPEVRAEVLRREQDFHKGLEGYKGWAKIGQDLDAEIRPYDAMIRAAGATPQAIIKDVFNTIYQLKTGNAEQKAAVALNILNEYGVDLDAVQLAAQKVAEGQPAIDPQVAHLQQQLTATNQRIEEQEKAALRQEFAGIVQEADAFKNAKGHEHYESVKLDMAAFIESGVCSTLQEAYDKAIWANPEVRAKLEAERQKADRKLAADKAAAAKKAASTNVVPRGTLPGAPKVGTMDDTLRAKLREINARG